MNQLLYWTSQRLRLSNPWKHKVPFLMSIPYLVILLGKASWQEVYLMVLCSYITTIGIAGFGYTTNDLSDIRKDKRAGKQNPFADLNILQKFLIVCLCLIIAFCPWFWLPFNQFSISLLFLEIFLFIAYAFPPFRLKEKGFVGVVTDSLYAHVIPIILASYTFTLVIGKTYSNYLIEAGILCTWQMILGIRNILFHQIKDYEADKISGIQTFVGNLGKRKVNKLIQLLFLPLELLLFISFMTLLTPIVYFFLPCFIFYSIWIYIRERKKIKGYQLWTHLIIDDFYNEWIPLIVLIQLVFQEITFVGILLIHFLLFRNGLKTIYKMNSWRIAIFSKHLN